MRSGRPLTQGELGRQIGYSDATVGAVERAALRPDLAFMEGCERALPAAGMLRAMFAFVLAEWDVFERTGQRPLVDPLPPAEMLHDAANVTGPEDLVVVQEGDLVDVLELARQAEASDLGGGTLEVIDRTVDRFCRDYPTAAPAVLVRRVELRLHYLAKLLRGKVTLAQHRHLLVDSGWLATLLACLQFDLGDRDSAEASQAAAYTFAHEAEHEELLAWTHELLAWWALVDHRYDEVIDHTEPLVLAAAQLTIGTCLLGVAMPWLGRQPVTLSATVVASVVAFGVLSTGIAYVLNYRLIQDEGPTAASMTNYLTPVVAVLLGVAVVDEPLSWNLVAGTAMVLLGVWIAERNLGGRGSAASDTSALSEDDVAQPQEHIR
jgi:hypothetical protein